jgi:hypothetical protein
MLSGNGRNGLLVFLSLLISSAAGAAPIVGDYNRDAIAPALSENADAHVLSCEINQTNKLYNPYLASAAAEFLKPPAVTNLQGLSMQAKSLPPAPGAIFLGLTGFLCVSLVKDRRVWLTVLAGLLWLGQTGFTALPHFASHLRSKKQIQQSSPTLTYISELEGSYRPRSDIEGTQYIGLLRHLAGIPATANSVQRRAYTLHTKRYTLTAKRHTNKVTQFAIIKLLSEIVLPTNCLVFTAEQSVPFSPAFIFSRLARGPPGLTYSVIPAPYRCTG